MGFNKGNRFIAIRQKIKLGDVLVNAGTITEEQLQQALAEQKQKDIPLGKALVQLGFLTEEKFLNNLAAQLKIPYLDMQGVKISQEAIRKVSESVARKHMIIPIDIGFILSTTRPAKKSETE